MTLQKTLESQGEEGYASTKPMGGLDAWDTTLIKTARKTMAVTCFYAGALRAALEEIIREFDTDQDNVVKIIKGLILLEGVANRLEGMLGYVRRTTRMIRREMGVGSTSVEELVEIMERLKELMEQGC